VNNEHDILELEAAAFNSISFPILLRNGVSAFCNASIYIEYGMDNMGYLQFSILCSLDMLFSPYYVFFVVYNMCTISELVKKEYNRVSEKSEDERVLGFQRG